MKVIHDAMTEGRWCWHRPDPNKPPRIVTKGCNSTRCNSIHISHDAHSILSRIRDSHHRDLDGACRQDAWLLQAEMEGVRLQEGRLYFTHGLFDSAILTQRDPVDDSLKAPLIVTEIRHGIVGERDPTDADAVRKPSVLDLGASILPHMVGFAQLALRACESHCKLVSNSGEIRVDIGVEVEHVDSFYPDLGAKATEADLIQALPEHTRHQWFSTGQGAVVRFFVNEVTSTLDINWFTVSAALRSAACFYFFDAHHSSSTVSRQDNFGLTMPVPWTAAVAALRQMKRVLQRHAPQPEVTAPNKRVTMNDSRSTPLKV
jgi:hypothetical protein